MPLKWWSAGVRPVVFLPATLDNLLQQLPDARGEFIEDCGYVLYLERGADVVAAITRFIATSRV
ncbi:hypothetical protein B0E42_08000 [Pseudomonas sp. A25(2017)]|uniref:hypothetical protein n=1 Tax=Pseudomonas sp. A25(2017) TaxID=1945865 RepID=UPI00098673DC|nr:hypothetical protein [Pseudomonas sp. A25(2017)]OOG87516.1 hypothetical protein B0E42_08000 [Pseudomonas sp. A25(2017)]